MAGASPTRDRLRRGSGWFDAARAEISEIAKGALEVAADATLITLEDHCIGLMLSGQVVAEYLTRTLSAAGVSPHRAFSLMSGMSSHLFLLLEDSHLQQLARDPLCVAKIESPQRRLTLRDTKTDMTLRVRWALVDTAAAVFRDHKTSFAF
jgi:hypothetical protein